MFSKIKKVLVSLALASSLALAPMNVSAGTLTQSSSAATTTATYQAIDKAYSVTVPDSINFTSDVPAKSLTINVTDNLVGHSITVTPSFTPKEGVNASIAFNNASVTISDVSQATITATLDDTNLDAKDYLNSTEIGTISYTVVTNELTS